MSKKYSLFEYHQGSSFFHKCPSWIKLLLIPVLSALVLFLPPIFSAILVTFQFVLACILRISIKEQLRDLRPVLLYALLFFLFQLSTYLTNQTEMDFTYAYNFLKLFSVVQTASLVYKTTTSLEIRNGIEKILGGKNLFTDSIFLFLNFIPMVSKIWSDCEKAWLSRGGKKNLKMYIKLLSILFSVGMKKAWATTRAILARTN